MSQELKRALPRLTKQRKAIFAALQGDTSHPTAEEIYWRVKHELPHISLATVYRNLKQTRRGAAIRAAGSRNQSPSHRCPTGPLGRGTE